MSDPSEDRTASLMTPARLAQLKLRPKPAATPAVWLDQLAADAGSGHVRRLVDLRRQLEGQVRAAAIADLPAACRALDEAAAAVDFELLQPRGWFSRVTGQGKEAAATFAGQHERMRRAGDAFALHVQSLQKAQAAAQAGVDRTLLEFDAETRQLEKIMDQGARWLQDMRNQLKSRQADAADDAALQQVAQDTARCELLVGRLKQLRAAGSATQQVAQRCKAAAAARAALLGALQGIVDGPWQAARRTAAVAADGTDAAREARQALQSALRQAIDEAAAAQAQDHALLEEVAALQAPLQAAA